MPHWKFLVTSMTTIRTLANTLTGDFFLTKIENIPSQGNIIPSLAHCKDQVNKKVLYYFFSWLPLKKSKGHSKAFTIIIQNTNCPYAATLWERNTSKLFTDRQIFSMNGFLPCSETELVKSMLLMGYLKLSELPQKWSSVWQWCNVYLMYLCAHNITFFVESCGIQIL